MKKLLLPILFALMATNSNAYTPIVYINGKPHNAGLPYGLATAQEYMTSKDDELAQSFDINHTSIAAHPENHDAEYQACITGLTYHQKLEALTPGLFMEAFLPIAFVANKLPKHVTINNGKVSLTEKDYETWSTKSALADITLLAGYQLIEAEDCNAAISVDVILPTQLSNKGKTPVTPTMGNGGHVAPGISINGDLTAFGNERHNIKVFGQMQYHYNLEAIKQNLFGINQENYDVSNITVGEHAVFNAAASIAYTYHKFFIDAGLDYHVTTEKNLVSNDTHVFGKSYQKIQLNGKTVTLKNIGVGNQTATIPTSHLLNVHADLGLANKEFSHPLLFDIPVSGYVSVGSNATILNKNHPSSWDVNIKTGITF